MSSTRTGRWSIRRRLILAALLFGITTLGLAAVLLVGLFQNQLNAQVRTDLENSLVQLIASTEQSRTGEYTLRNSLAEQRYDRPLSGWAWQVRRGEEVLLQSASLGPIGSAGALAVVAADTNTLRSFTGPLGKELIGLSREVRPRFGNERLLFAVARPQQEIRATLTQFQTSVAVVLVILGVGQGLMVLWLMRVSLRPLQALKRRVEALRTGTKADDERPAVWPQELTPVVDEMDALEGHVDRLVERARSQSADLAHTIKTPLAVLHQIADNAPEDIKAALRQQNRRIDSALDRHLALAQSRGRGRETVDLGDVIEEVCAALSRSMEARSLTLAKDCEDDLQFRGDENDAYELIGNLLDNAVKWASGNIRLSARVQGGAIRLEVEDDGPGVSPELRSQILSRGMRLDERQEGQGLGLSIVGDLVDLYEGRMELEKSTLGGLAVSLWLPHAIR